MGHYDELYEAEAHADRLRSLARDAGPLRGSVESVTINTGKRFADVVVRVHFYGDERLQRILKLNRFDQTLREEAAVRAAGTAGEVPADSAPTTF